MDYTRQIWKDHIVERPRTYTETFNSDGSKTLVPAPGEIYQQGTPMNAEHFNHIEQGIVNMNARIQEVENGKASTASYTATLNKQWWTPGPPATQTVDVPGMLATDNPFVDVDVSEAASAADAQAMLEAWMLVGRVEAKAGSITAYCYDEIPTSADMKLILKVVR